MDGIQAVLDTLCSKVDQTQRIGFHALAVRRTKAEVQKDVDNEERGWKSAVCAAEWNGFKEVLKYICGMEFFFTRTDEYFGICTEDEEIWLFKEER